MRLFLPAFFEDLFAALDLNLTGAQCRLLCFPVVLGVLRPGEVLDELPDEFLGFIVFLEFTSRFGFVSSKAQRVRLVVGEKEFPVALSDYAPPPSGSRKRK